MTRGIITAVVLMTLSSSGALACNVGDRPTRDNFKKLIACVNALEIANTQLFAQFQALQAAVNQMDNAHAVTAIRAYDDQIPANTGPWPGMNGTFSLNDPRSTCPPGSWISGIQGFKLGAGGIQGPIQPVSGLRYICRSLKPGD
jgi:hypothetical protein